MLSFYLSESSNWYLELFAPKRDDLTGAMWLMALFFN